MTRNMSKPINQMFILYLKKYVTTKKDALLPLFLQSIIIGFAIAIWDKNQTLRDKLNLKRRNELKELSYNEGNFSYLLENVNANISMLQDQLKPLRAQIFEEKYNVFEYKNIESSVNSKFMVALGVTGVGKSSVLNRLRGDMSEEATVGPFETGGGAEPGTYLCIFNHVSIKFY